MRPSVTLPCSFLNRLMVLAFVLWASPAIAQVKDVVVGITPTCPYGLSACWSGAYGALGCLDGVKSVAGTPDVYNCTAAVVLKEAHLPDVAAWAQQFEAAVGGVYVFRGIEVTAEGTVEERDRALVLLIPGVTTPLTLRALEHKLQWNFKKKIARQAEPDEVEAYANLATKRKESTGAAFTVRVTGPVLADDHGVVLEVREWFPNNAERAAH